MKDKIIKIGQNTNITLDLKTLIIVVTFAISLCSVYFSLKADIAEAKALPKPTLSVTEWQIKDELIRTTIMNNAQGIAEIKSRLAIIEGRLYDINNLIAQ